MEFNAYRISEGTLVAIAVVIVGSGVLAIVLRRRGGVRLGRSIWIGLSSAAAFSVLVITLSPGRSGGTYACELSGSVFDWLRGNQSTANVAMLVPVAVALPIAAQGTRWYRWSFAALIALPVIIEVAQALVPLGRACDGMDIVDNWIGVTLGCLLGWAGTSMLPKPTTTQP